MKWCVLALLGTLGCSQESGLTAKEGLLDISPLLTDLGLVATGTTLAYNLQFDNIQGGALQVYSVTVNNISGEYFLDPETFSFDIGEAESYVLPMQYSPTEEGFHYAEIVIVSDGTDDMITAEVRAQAVDAEVAMWPSVLDFGPVDVGSVGYAAVTMANQGDVSFSFTGAHIENELFALETLDELELAPGETGAINLSFTPKDTSAQLGQMVATIDATATVGEVILMGNNCEGGTPNLYDVDEDGFTSCGGDCDDNDPTINPAADESYNKLDDDCDGIIDEGTIGYDDDGDGYTELEGDCNDGIAAVSPGTPEIADNGIDDDCDGVVDDGDNDNDYDGYSEYGGDCDDFDADVHPGAPELEDGKDNDCDGIVDEGTDAYDDDGDGYTEYDGDCDDSNAATYPGASELEDWVDNDCDGDVDEGTAHSDDDGDGFSEVGGDCDDADPNVSPAQLEIEGDGIDNDCDGKAL